MIIYKTDLNFSSCYLFSFASCNSFRKLMLKVERNNEKQKKKYIRAFIIDVCSLSVLNINSIGSFVSLMVNGTGDIVIGR